MVDYQYITPKELRHAFSQVSTSQLIEEDQPLHIMPPIFSRIDVPGSYNYQPEVSKRTGSKSNPLHVPTKGDEEDWTKYVFYGLIKLYTKFYNFRAIALEFKISQIRSENSSLDWSKISRFLQVNPSIYH